MLGARESDLIAVARAPSPEWIELLREAWDAGAAVLPIDHRLPPAERDRIVEAARPAIVATDDHVRRVEGEPVAPGVGLVMATGGSMGAPKLVELTRDAIDAAVDASLARLEARPGDAWLCLLPFAHMGGLLCLLRAMRAGAPAVFDGAAAFTSVVPTMLHRGFDPSGFKAVLVGGAPDATGSTGPLVRTYGMTESCGGVVYDGVPLNGVRVRIGEDDEIQIAGPTLMRGYRRATTKQPFTDDGWLRTNDAGALVDGKLTVLGRLDDVIVTGGEKVWPDEVEAALRAYDKVRDVVVAGRADPEWGSIVVAHVVPRDPADPPTLDDLRAIPIARYKLPKALELHDEIPALPSGKPDRSQLRNR